MLRDYQQAMKAGLFRAWEDGHRNVMCVMPTGAGKTKTMAAVSGEVGGRVAAIAHRKELVGQIAMAHAWEGIPHRIIAPPAVVNGIIARQIDEIGRSWFHPSADVAIAGVDTLIRREDEFFESVTHGQMDEGHHVLEANKWGTAMKMLGRQPSLSDPTPATARWALWTATPRRSDGKALRFGKGGMAHHLIVGPTPRELIRRGYLTDYRVYGLPEEIDLAEVAITGTGDYSPRQLSRAAHKSKITGSIVEHYRKITPGKQACVFAVDVSMSHDHAEAFTAAGFPARVIHGGMSTGDRDKIVRAYERREFPVLINVDILGEGFDCPGIEVVIFARPTASYGLYVQQFGRVLRILEGKAWGIILDAVGNVRKHGLPDGRVSWSLDAPERKKKPREIPVRICTNPECMLAYEDFGIVCPYCGTKMETPRPAGGGRTGPEVVEGDLTEYPPDMLARLRGEIDRIMGEPEIPFGASQGIQRAVAAKWGARRSQQERLRDAIARWAGFQRDIRQHTDAQSYRRFWHTFGTDVATAQTLSAREAGELADRVLGDIGEREEQAA